MPAAVLRDQRTLLRGRVGPRSGGSSTASHIRPSAAVCSIVGCANVFLNEDLTHDVQFLLFAFRFFACSLNETLIFKAGVDMGIPEIREIPDWNFKN